MVEAVNGYGRLTLLALSCALAPGVLHAQQNDALLHAVDQHYNHLTSLRTHYTERYEGMGLHRVETGVLTLRKPGNMRWEYDTPRGKLFILDGKFAWFYTPGDPEVQRLPAKSVDDLRTPLRFLLGHTQLQRELANISVHPEGAGFHIAGVPKGLVARVKSLALDVTASGQILGMKVEEIDGATTEFQFSAMVENVATRPADFIFVPPAGVVIVNSLPPI